MEEAQWFTIAAMVVVSNNVLPRAEHILMRYLLLLLPGGINENFVVSKSTDDDNQEINIDNKFSK